MIERPIQRIKLHTDTRDPIATDDSNAGYGYFSFWINTNTDEVFTCTEATPGAAVWKESGTGGAAHVDTVPPSVNDDETKGFNIGNLWLDVTAEVIYVCLSAATGAAVWKETPGAGAGLYRTGLDLNVGIDGESSAVSVDDEVVAATRTKVDREHTPNATSGDDQDTGIRITLKPGGKGSGPLGDKMIEVKVRGVAVSVGDGVTTEACFFSASAGAPYAAKNLADVARGDKLIWNGVVAGYDLDGDDVVGLIYETLEVSGAGGAIWGVGEWGDFVWGA